MESLGELVLGAKKKRKKKPMTEPVGIPTGGGGIVIQLRAPTHLIDDVIRRLDRADPSEPVVIDLLCDESLSALNQVARESGTELRLRILAPDVD